MEESPTHTPAAVSELQLASAKIYEHLEDDIPLILLSPLVLPSSKSPVSPVSPEIPPSHPLLSPHPKVS